VVLFVGTFCTYLIRKDLFMTAARPNVFWIGALAAIALMVVLLHDILLPFVAGIALAYLLDPLVERIERLGVSPSPTRRHSISLLSR
jgi:predicted PurR-regulated permease PerM